MIQRITIMSVGFVIAMSMAATPLLTFAADEGMMGTAASSTHDMTMTTPGHKTMSTALHEAWKKHMAAMASAKQVYEKELRAARSVYNRVRKPDEKKKAQEMYIKTKKKLEEIYNTTLKQALSSWDAAVKADAMNKKPAVQKGMN